MNRLDISLQETASAVNPRGPEGQAGGGGLQPTPAIEVQLDHAAGNRAGVHVVAADAALTSSSDAFTLGRFFDALDAAGCCPVWTSRGGIKSFCPVCGSGRSGRPALRAAQGDTGAVVFYCHRCCIGIDKIVDTAARQEILDQLGIDWSLTSGAPIPRDIAQRIGAYRTALDRAEAAGAFKGQSGATTLRLMRTAADFAQAARSTTFRGSTRQYALGAGRTRTTASKGLKRAEADGWIKSAAPFGALVDRSTPGGLRSVGRGWALTIPPAWAALENGTERDSSRCPHCTETVTDHSILSPGGAVARACGAGREVWRTLGELIARDEPAAAADIAAVVGLNPRTVKNHLALLVKMGAAALVEPGARGRGKAAKWAAVDGAVEVLAVVGEPIRAAAAAKFQAERAAYAHTFDVALAARKLQRVKVDPSTGEVAVDPVTGDVVLAPPDSLPDGFVAPVWIPRKPRPRLISPAVKPELIEEARRRGGVIVGMVPA